MRSGVRASREVCVCDPSTAALAWGGRRIESNSFKPGTDRQPPFTRSVPGNQFIIHPQKPRGRPTKTRTAVPQMAALHHHARTKLACRRSHFSISNLRFPCGASLASIDFHPPDSPDTLFQGEARVSCQRRLFLFLPD